MAKFVLLTAMSVVLRTFAVFFIFGIGAFGEARLPVANLTMAIILSFASAIGWEIADTFSNIKFGWVPSYERKQCDECLHPPLSTKEN